MSIKFFALLLSTALFSNTSLYADETPTGCPETWGLRLEEGREVSGKLSLAQKKYGSSKMYSSIETTKRVRDLSLKSGNTYSLNQIGSLDNWTLAAKAVQMDLPIEMIDKLTVKFEGCSEYSIQNSRTPIRVVIEDSGMNFKSAFAEWTTNYDALNPNYPVTLKAKEEIVLGFENWLARIKSDSTVNSVSPTLSVPPVGSFLGSRSASQYGFEYLLMPRKNQSCLILTKEAAYPGEYSLLRGCSYDVVLVPPNSQAAKNSHSSLITLVKIDAVSFQPYLSPKTSKSPSATVLKTIVCKKGTLRKTVKSALPKCPKGYVKQS